MNDTMNYMPIKLMVDPHSINSKTENVLDNLIDLK